jgi:hypothetical protein
MGKKSKLQMGISSRPDLKNDSLGKWKPALAKKTSTQRKIRKKCEAEQSTTANFAQTQFCEETLTGFICNGPDASLSGQ